MPLMGFREYARHREAENLVGGTLAAVQTAIKSGRITAAVVEVDGRRLIDQARADGLWSERSAQRIHTESPTERGAADEVTTEPSKRTPAAKAAGEVQAIADNDDDDLEDASYAAARAARERANAKRAQLEVEALQGRLVDHAAVTEAWEKIIGTSRTKVLALPSKIRTRIPKLTASEVSVIEGIVRDTLDELAQGAI